MEPKDSETLRENPSPLAERRKRVWKASLSTEKILVEEKGKGYENGSREKRFRVRRYGGLKQQKNWSSSKQGKHTEAPNPKYSTPRVPS